MKQEPDDICCVIYAVFSLLQHKTILPICDRWSFWNWFSYFSIVSIRTKNLSVFVRIYVVLLSCLLNSGQMFSVAEILQVVQ